MSVFKAPLHTIREGKFKVRTRLDPYELSKLRDSIRKQGDVINPIPVRPLPDGTFEALGGHRRLQAAREAGLKEISIRIFKAESEAEAWRMAYHEDALKEPWSPIAKALAFKRMREDGMKLEDVALIAGVSAELVSNTLRLLELPEDVKALIDDGRLTLRHGLELLRLRNKPEELMSLAMHAAEEMWSVAKLKIEIDSILKEELSLVKVEEVPLRREVETKLEVRERTMKPETKLIEAKPMEKKAERVVPIRYAYTTCPVCGKWVEITHMSDGSHKLKMVKGEPMLE